MWYAVVEILFKKHGVLMIGDRDVCCMLGWHYEAFLEGKRDMSCHYRILCYDSHQFLAALFRLSYRDIVLPWKIYVLRLLERYYCGRMKDFIRKGYSVGSSMWHLSMRKKNISSKRKQDTSCNYSIPWLKREKWVTHYLECLPDMYRVKLIVKKKWK